MGLPSYKKLLEQSEDGKCGALILAGQPIVLPFISARTAALSVAKAIRLESGYKPCKAVEGRMDDMRSIRATQPEQ